MPLHLTAQDFIARVEDEGLDYTLMGYYSEEDLHEIEDAKLRRCALRAHAALLALQERIDQVRDAETDWLCTNVEEDDSDELF